MTRTHLFFLLISLGLIFPQVNFGQSSHASMVRAKAATLRINEGTGLPDYVELKLEARFTAAQFPEKAAEYFRFAPGNSLSLIRSEEDQIGGTHYRYQQYHEGIPVVGGMIIAHEKEGQIVSFNGSFLPTKEAVSAGLSESEALAEVLDQTGAETYIWESADAENHLKMMHKDPSATYFPKGTLAWVPATLHKAGTQSRLTWKFDIYAESPLSREDVYADAQTGEIIFTNPTLLHTDVPGSAATAYSGNQNIIMDDDSGSYRLQEAGRGGGIFTLNMMQSDNYSAAADFVSTNTVWDTTNVEMDEVAGDAHWGCEMVYDYFLSKHGRDSYDNLGSPIYAYIHYNTNYSNAFWNGSVMTFGDGNGASTLPLVSVDVVAHELTHGVTGNSAGLIYQNEMGALNESFSDIFGNATEFFAKEGDWAVGEDFTFNGFRDMASPKSKGDPNTYFGENWVTGTSDNGGVHTNSGVQNYWFYLLTEGGSSSNDNLESYTVTGIGMEKAAQIAYRNLSVYLTPVSEYKEARYYSIRSAIDLFGECSEEMKQVMNAWHAVGVGGKYSDVPVADFTADLTSFCTVPADVNFTAQDEGGIEFWWNFGDLDISTLPYPTKTYNFGGVYDVTLIVTGCDGATDTLVKEDYIIVDPDAICVFQVPVANAHDTINGSCAGYLLDTGGEDNYMDNQHSKITITSPDATTIDLTFLEFKYANSGDFISIHDGGNATSPLIGLYRGTDLSPGDVVSSTGPIITIRELTNASSNFSGFSLFFQSCAVGVEEDNFQESISVYPNPASSTLNISVGEMRNGFSWELIDLHGKMIQKGSENGSFTSLNVAGIAEGIYFMKVSSDGRESYAKVVLRSL